MFHTRYNGSYCLWLIDARYSVSVYIYDRVNTRYNDSVYVYVYDSLDTRDETIVHPPLWIIEWCGSGWLETGDSPLTWTITSSHHWWLSQVQSTNSCFHFILWCWYYSVQVSNHSGYKSKSIRYLLIKVILQWWGIFFWSWNKTSNWN